MPDPQTKKELPKTQTIQVPVPIEYDSTLVVSCRMPAQLPEDRLKRAGGYVLPREQVEAASRGKIDLSEKEFCAKAIDIVNKEQQSRPVIQGIAQSFIVTASKLESYRSLPESNKNLMKSSLLDHKNPILARQTQANFKLILSSEFDFVSKCIGVEGMSKLIQYAGGETEHLKINLKALNKIFYQLASDPGFGNFPDLLKSQIFSSFSLLASAPLKADLKPTQLLSAAESLQAQLKEVLAVKDKEGKSFDNFHDAIKLGLREKFFEPGARGIFNIFKPTLSGTTNQSPEIFDFKLLDPTGLSADKISFALSKTLEYAQDGGKPLKQVVQRYNILLHAPESVALGLYSQFGLEPGKTPLPGNNPTKVTALDFAAAVVSSGDLNSLSRKEIETLGNRIRTIDFISSQSNLAKIEDFDLLLRSVKQYSDGVFSEGGQKLSLSARQSLLRQVLNAPVKFNPDSFHPNLHVSFPDIKRDNYTHSKHTDEEVSFDLSTPKKLTRARSWRMEFDSHSILMTKPLVDHPKMEESMISTTERTLAGLPTQLRRQVKQVKFMPEPDADGASMRAGNGVIYIYPLNFPSNDTIPSIYHEYGHILVYGSAVSFTKSDRAEWQSAINTDPASLSQYGREGFSKAIDKNESKIDEDIAELTSIYLPARFGRGVDAEKSLRVLEVLYPNRIKLLEKKISTLLAQK